VSRRPTEHWVRWLLALAVMCVWLPVHANEPKSGPARWQLDVQWWNDLFADPPPADDQGFTNDFLLGFEWAMKSATGRVEVFYRIITERYGIRRWDQVDLTGAWKTSRRVRGWDMATSARTGLSLGGSFGGQAIQGTWHRVTGSGITVDQGLQSLYDGDRRIAVLVGGRGAVSRRLSLVRGRVGIDAQAALGSTGVSRMWTYAGATLEVPIQSWRLSLDFELVVARYHTSDPNLKLRGGYGTGAWQLEPRLSLAAGVAGHSFGWQYRANESGSGEAVGLFFFRTNL